MADIDRGQALDWDDSELSDEGGFVLVPEGTYPFIVTKLEKGRFEGSEKMAPCPRAIVTIEVVTPAGAYPVIDRMMLNTKQAWRIAKFFEGLGYKKNPETGKVPVRWNEIEGKQGWVEVGVREYTANGQTRQANEVKKYLAPSEWPDSTATMQFQGAPAAQPAQTAYTQGSF